MSEIGGVSIKITLDDSAIKTQLEGIKSSLKSVSKINTGSATKGLSSGLKQTANVANTLKKEIINTTNAAGKFKSTIKETKTSITTLADGTKEITKNITHTNSEQKKSGSTLNSMLATSMKILRITTTVTAMYALIKTAVNAWLNTIKAVFSVYQKLGQVIAATVSETSKFVYEFSGAKTVMNAINSVVGEIAGKIKEAFSVDNLKNFISEANELASDLIEVRNILNVIYDDAAKNSVSGWAQGIYSTFGLNELSALEYNTKFGAMLNSTGFDSNTYSAMSKNLTQLTADYASLFNMDYDAVFQKIQSGLAGQTKGMLAFGTSVHAATIEEYLLSKGIDVTWNSLSNAAKWYARYAYMIETAKDYQGDFNRTQWQFANNMRVVGQLIETIKIQIGSLINAALTPLTIVLRVVLEEVNAVVSGLLKLFNIDTENSSLMAIGDDYSYMMDDMLDDTNEAVKKIKRSLTSFDELHQLKDDDSGNGLGGAGISLQDLIDQLGVSYAQVEAYEPEIVKKIREMIEKIKDAWTARDFTDIGRTVGQKLKEGFMWINSHWTDIFSVLEGVGKSFATFLNGLFEDPSLFTEVARTLAGSIKSIMITAYGFLANLKPENIGGGIGSFINGIFETDDDGLTLLDVFAKNIALAINNLGVIVQTAMSKIDIVDMGNKISNAINLLFENVNFAGLGDAARTLLTKVFGSLAVAMQTIKWEDIGLKLDSFLQNLFEVDENGDTFLDCAANIITGFVNGLITAANTVLSGEGIEKMNTELDEFFQTIKDNINWEGLNDVGQKLLEELQLLINGALSSIDWMAILPAIVDGLQMIIEGVIVFLAASIAAIGLTLLQIIHDSIIEPIVYLVAAFVLLIVNELLRFLNHMKGLFIALKDLVVFLIKELFVKIEEIYNKIKEYVILIIKWLADKIIETKDNISDFKDNVIEIFGNLWEGIKEIFGGVADWFKGIFEDAANGIKGAMQKVKDFFGFGEDTNVNVNASTSAYNVPHYANGGYLRANNPQLAVVGDNKTRAEIISPDDKMAAIFDERIHNFFNNEFVDMMTTAFTKAVNNAGGNGGTANIYLDGQLIARSVMAEQQINNARGRR